MSQSLGSIDHVSIRQLQLILLKVALIIGCEFIENIAFEEICPKSLFDNQTDNKENKISSTCNCSTTSFNESDKVLPQPTTKRKLNSSKESAKNDDSNMYLDEYLAKESGGSSHSRPDEKCSNSSGEEDSEIDSDTSSNDMGEENKTLNPDDEEGVKEKKSQESVKLKNVKENCNCCCHLHVNDDRIRYWLQGKRNMVGAYAHFSLTSSNPATSSANVNYEYLLKKLHKFPFNILIGADGRRNTLNDNFPRKGDSLNSII